MEDFTKEFVRGCQRNYYPDRVMIEYNGMYSIDDLMDVVDETDLELYQVIVTVDASTADLYLKNMKSMSSRNHKCYGTNMVCNNTQRSICL